jgi:hypothetical protein
LVEYFGSEKVAKNASFSPTGKMSFDGENDLQRTMNTEQSYCTSLLKEI